MIQETKLFFAEAGRMKTLHQPLILDARTPYIASIGEEENYYFLQHWHDELEILYLLRGQATVTIDSIPYTAQEGDIVLVAPNILHDVSIELGVTAQHLLVECGVALLGEDFQTLSGRVFPSPLLKASDFGTAQTIRRLLDRITHELQNNKPGKDTAIRALIGEIFVTLLRDVPSEPGSKSGQALLQQTRWNAVFEYIANHFDDDLRMEDAAECAGYSTYHFCRCFREHTGVSFHRYVNRYRIEHATRLLREASLPVTQVASQSGFDSIKTFNRVFKSEIGMSPSAYRAEMSAQNGEKNDIDSPHKKAEIL